MHRRDLLNCAGAASLPMLFAANASFGQPAKPADGKKLPPLKITDVKTILTAPAGIRLVVVKVDDQRAGPLRPRLRHLHAAGPRRRDGHRQVPQAVPDRQGPAADRGHLAVDVRQLATGATAACSATPSAASTWPAGTSSASAPACRSISCSAASAARPSTPIATPAAHDFRGGREGQCPQAHGAGLPLRPRAGRRFPGWRPTASAAQRRHGEDDPAIPPTPAPAPGSRAAYCPARCRKLFEHLRKQLGDEVELLHDIHERVPPILAMQLVQGPGAVSRSSSSKTRSARRTSATSSNLRQQTSTPIAMGELFNNPNEYVSLISERLIDFIRIHISQIGGLTPARKVAALCEFFGVRTAWHGPGDVSPVGHAANVHLDLARPQLRHPGRPRVHAGGAGRLPRLPGA